MTDNDFINKLIAISNKKCRLVKFKSNRALVEIYVDDFMIPCYKLKFSTIRNARVFLLNIHCYKYEEIKEEELKEKVKYIRMFD